MIENSIVLSDSRKRYFDSRGNFLKLFNSKCRNCNNNGFSYQKQLTLKIERIENVAHFCRRNRIVKRGIVFRYCHPRVYFTGNIKSCPIRRVYADKFSFTLTFTAARLKFFMRDVYEASRSGIFINAVIYARASFKQHFNFYYRSCMPRNRVLRTIVQIITAANTLIEL